MKLKTRLLLVQDSKTHHVVKVSSVFLVLARVKAHFCVAGLCFLGLAQTHGANQSTAPCFLRFNVPLRMNKVPSTACTYWLTHSPSSRATLLRDNVHSCPLVKEDNLRRIDKTRFFLFCSWLVQKDKFKIQATAVSRSRAAEDFWSDQCAASAQSHAGQVRLEHLSAMCHVQSRCQRWSNHTLFYSPHFSWFESIEGGWGGGGVHRLAGEQEQALFQPLRLNQASTLHSLWVHNLPASLSGETKESERERESSLAGHSVGSISRLQIKLLHSDLFNSLYWV